MREIFQLITGEKSVYPGYIVDHSPKVKDAKIIDLIDQVEGIDRDQEPPTGLFARFKRKEKIDLNTQLQAVRELGHSASQEALEFLNWLCTPRFETTSVVTSQFGSWDITASGDYYQEVYYPNARGPLREKLLLSVHSGNFNIDDYTLSQTQIEEELNHQRASLPAHMIINSAIQNLKKDLQLTAQPDSPS